MKTENDTAEKVLNILLREPFAMHTATSIAKALSISRQGIWKTFNKLASNKMINVESVGNAKTSTAIIRINWTNPITEKTLVLLLTKESLKQRRWMVNFAELENNVDFLILFGSILHSPKDANDIDILAVADKKKFKPIEEITTKLQQTQLKKIHCIDATVDEFNHELRRPNKAYRDAIKKGVVLYGQDNFISCIRDLQK